MRIYTSAGDLAFKTFTFPDGQPHFKLETYELDFRVVTIEVAIRSGHDLLLTVLASDTLRAHGYSEVNLDIRYLLGARMDRAIDSTQPYTLQSIARIINACGFSKVRILDVHSDVATRLIRNSTNVLPHQVVSQVLTTVGKVSVAIPDKGALYRVQMLCQGKAPLFQCLKKRDMATGNLSGFEAPDYNPHCTPGRLQNSYDVLIVDDICDGGGTFTGLAKVLREAGAKRVYLFVTHGIFSKGLPLEGIDRVFTTDSYINYPVVPNPLSETKPSFGQSTSRLANNSDNLTVIPISMKEMK